MRNESKIMPFFKGTETLRILLYMCQLYAIKN